MFRQSTEDISTNCGGVYWAVRTKHVLKDLNVISHENGTEPTNC